jgi:chromosome partitioning protein
MQTIVLASRKGGAGKTTTARHLAVEAERRGDGPVALIDTDPQGGLAKWWNRRADETPAFIASSLEELPADLAKLGRGGFRYTIIDTPPQVTDLIRSVVRLADLVLVPARPSPDDLDAVGATIDLVEECGKPMVFVINAATKKARLTGQAAIVLSQHGTVAPAVVHHSVAFPGSAIKGLTAGEVEPDGAPAQEVAELWAYVSARLSKNGAGKPSTPPASKTASKQAFRTASR